MPRSHGFLDDRRISEVLAEFRTALPEERVTLADTMAALGDRTIGGILHLLSASEESLRDELLAAVIAAGAEDHKNALQTIIWALEKGKKTKLLEIEDHGYD